MYCTNCGNQIPDQTKFCANCGAPAVQEPVTQDPVVQEPVTNTAPVHRARKEKKKRAPIGLVLLVVVAAGLFGKFVIAPSMLSEPESQPSVENETVRSDEFDPLVPDLSESSSAYSEIFRSRHIVRIPHTFFMMESASFARVDEDDVIEILEFGYEDDIVKEMINEIYYPVHGLNETEKNAFEDSVAEFLAQYEALSFCTVSGIMDNNYYSVTLHYTDLDVSANIQKMEELGLVSSPDGSLISMSVTENGLLTSGYVKN